MVCPVTGDLQQLTVLLPPEQSELEAETRTHLQIASSSVFINLFSPLHIFTIANWLPLVLLGSVLSRYTLYTGIRG